MRDRLSYTRVACGSRDSVFVLWGLSVSMRDALLWVHDRALTFLLEKLHDDRRDCLRTGNQKQMAVIEYV
jgi:hypothetical protein